MADPISLKDTDSRLNCKMQTTMLLSIHGTGITKEYDILCDLPPPP